MIKPGPVVGVCIGLLIATPVLGAVNPTSDPKVKPVAQHAPDARQPKSNNPAIMGAAPTFTSILSDNGQSGGLAPNPGLPAAGAMGDEGSGSGPQPHRKPKKSGLGNAASE